MAFLNRQICDLTVTTDLLTNLTVCYPRLNVVYFKLSTYFTTPPLSPVISEIVGEDLSAEISEICEELRSVKGGDSPPPMCEELSEPITETRVDSGTEADLQPKKLDFDEESIQWINIWAAEPSTEREIDTNQDPSKNREHDTVISKPIPEPIPEPIPKLSNDVLPSYTSEQAGPSTFEPLAGPSEVIAGPSFELNIEPCSDIPLEQVLLLQSGFALPSPTSPLLTRKVPLGPEQLQIEVGPELDASLLTPVNSPILNRRDYEARLCQDSPLFSRRSELNSKILELAAQSNNDADLKPETRSELLSARHELILKELNSKTRPFVRDNTEHDIPNSLRLNQQDNMERERSESDLQRLNQQVEIDEWNEVIESANRRKGG